MQTVSAQLPMLMRYLLTVVNAGVTSPRGSNATAVGALLSAFNTVPNCELKLMGPKMVAAVPLDAFNTLTLAPVLVNVSVATRPFWSAAERAALNADINS